MVNIIDLYLLEHSKEHKTPVFLPEAIKTNNLVVVLGSPGSGKTSILKKHSDTNEEAQFLKIKKFIKLNNQVNTDTTVLLLDGLDEYRSVSTDKTFVIEELANKLKSLNDIKIVISCREMDWYGENDKNALKDELDNDAVVFSIQALNIAQQKEMASIYNIPNMDVFIEKFSSYGFLDNPQMFTMIAELYMKNSDIDFSSKSELYTAFISGAKEKNVEILQNKTPLTSEEILKYSGYLAFYYMFTEVESFDDAFIAEISNKDKGYSQEKLIQVLNTSLFSHKIFIHRTIAEFTLAHFLVKEKMKHDDGLANERIKSLFVKKEKIPTEVRGVYAWLCSLHGDMSFIDVDPYYQAVYGDNSLFAEGQKKEIVLSVKQYAKEHPYFIDFWGIRNQLDGLALLYTPNLDNFYIEQLEEARFMKSHYIHFIVSILNTSDGLSEAMKEYLKKKIFDSNTPTYIKDDILEVFSEDLKFLLNVLNGIKDGDIEDSENTIKEFLLERLYLDTIKPDEIIKYLKLYNKPKYERLIIGNGMYLFSTKYGDKFKLAKSLLQLKNEDIFKKNENEHRFHGSGFIDEFISDYLYETILKYPKELDANQIYSIISELKVEVEKYTHLEFKPYTLIRKDDKKENEEKFRKLSDELYSLHLDKVISSSISDISGAIFDYEYLFPYPPNSIFNILLNKIKSVDNVEIKEELFSWALTYIPFGYDDNFNNYTNEVSQLKAISDEYGFEEKLNFRLSKKLPEWKEKREKQKTKEELERLEILRKNEEHFSKKTDEEILGTFSDLKYISDIVYFNNKNGTKYLKEKTYLRLKTILTKLIFTVSIDTKLTTLEDLSKFTKGSNRYIDQVYYTSMALNNIDDKSFKKINSDILGYFYINDLHHNNIGNIIESTFSEYIEHSQLEKVLEILKKYIQLLIAKHCKNLDFLFDKYISRDSSIERLKRIAMAREWNDHSIQDDILNKILKGYAFNFELDELEKINKILDSKSNQKIIIDALIVLKQKHKSKFTKEMAVGIFELFDYTSLYEETTTKQKVHIFDYMFTVFNTEESIKFVNGFQSYQSQCADFLTGVIKKLSLDELKSLYLLHNSEDSIWRNRILNELDTKEQQDADKSFDKYSIEKIKNFIYSDTIVSLKDFSEDISIKLNQIKQEIEDNRNNEKNQFYNDDGSSKNEEHCRDVILQKLNDKYGYDIDSTKEKYEADNRVDINIRYKTNLDYEVQVECKKDKSRDLYKGVKNQLIDKYLSSKVEFGIYLIFYFGEKKDKEAMLSKIDESFEEKYKDRIKIICIDLIK